MPDRRPRTEGGRSAPPALVLLALTLACAPHPTPQTGQHAHTFEQDDLRVHYLLFLPADYGQDRAKRWPLILFLHGSGERGSTIEDLARLEAHGLPRLVAERPDLEALTTRFIVLSPQCPGWYWRARFTALDALLAHVEATYAVDPQRVYLTGLSMGGFGAWQYALERPRRFAAVVPIAGGYGYSVETVYVGAGQSEIVLSLDPAPPENLCDLADVPVWVYHGEDDAGIPHQQTADVLVDALRACGGAEVRYTLYPGVGHEAWDRAYTNPALYDWLLAQERADD